MRNLRAKLGSKGSCIGGHNVTTEEEIFKTINHPVLGQLNFEYTSYLVVSDTNLKDDYSYLFAGVRNGRKDKTISNEPNLLEAPEVRYSMVYYTNFPLTKFLTARGY